MTCPSSQLLYRNGENPSLWAPLRLLSQRVLYTDSLPGVCPAGPEAQGTLTLSPGLPRSLGPPATERSLLCGDSVSTEKIQSCHQILKRSLEQIFDFATPFLFFHESSLLFYFSILLSFLKIIKFKKSYLYSMHLR